MTFSLFNYAEIAIADVSMYNKLYIMFRNIYGFKHVNLLTILTFLRVPWLEISLPFLCVADQQLKQNDTLHSISCSADSPIRGKAVLALQLPAAATCLHLHY